MKLDHIVLLVSRLEECLPFYDTLLPLIGFSKEREHAYVNSQGIYLDFREATEPEHEYRRYGPGLNHIGFTAASRTELTSIGRVMGAAGFTVPEIQEFEDSSALFLLDSDGMRIELSCYK